MKKSQSQEDYLKFIHEAGHGQYVSNKEIATGLNVAPPSVSEMITKLAQEGLVAYKPYSGAMLTPQGKKLAIELVRKHEIWEYLRAKFILRHRNYRYAETLHVRQDFG